LFEIELGTYELYLPDQETLASLAPPVHLLVSEDGLPFFGEIAGRLGERVGVDVALSVLTTENTGSTENTGWNALMTTMNYCRVRAAPEVVADEVARFLCE
jgi:hypothetical protein